MEVLRLEADKKEKVVQLAQIGTVIAYIFLVMHSTVGEYLKITRKNMKNDAKRKEKLKKEKYKQKKRKLKRKTHRRYFR